MNTSTYPAGIYGRYLPVHHVCFGQQVVPLPPNLSTLASWLLAPAVLQDGKMRYQHQENG